jgi:hypothetical protein
LTPSTRFSLSAATASRASFQAPVISSVIALRMLGRFSVTSRMPGPGLVSSTASLRLWAMR